MDTKSGVLMRRVGVLALILFCALHVSGQTSSMLEVSAGGGWSSLGHHGSYGWNAHAGYGFFFCPYIGLGLGVDVARYGSDFTTNEIEQGTLIRDSEGESYEPRTEYIGWKNRLSVTMIEIPLSLDARAPLGDERTWLSMAVGAKVGFPLSGQATYRGQVNRTAWYDTWQLTLENMPNHGLESTVEEGTSALDTQIGYAAFARLGCETALDKKQRCFFIAQLSGTYYFTGTWSIGAEVGIRWHLRHIHHYKCMCSE